MRRISFSIPWPFLKEETREILSFAFLVSFVSYLGFTLMESIWPGFVSLYFHVNNWLYAAIIAGILTGIWPMITSATKKLEKIKWSSWAWMLVLAIGTFFIVWHKIKTLGNISVIVSALSGLVVFFLAWTVYTDGEMDNQERPLSDE